MISLILLLRTPIHQPKYGNITAKQCINCPVLKKQKSCNNSSPAGCTSWRVHTFLSTPAVGCQLHEEAVLGVTAPREAMMLQEAFQKEQVPVPLQVNYSVYFIHFNTFHQIILVCNFSSSCRVHPTHDTTGAIGVISNLHQDRGLSLSNS